MSDRYTPVAILLHWLMALGILALAVIGLTMTRPSTPPGLMFKLYQLHKSIGITVLLVAFLRLAWRLANQPPALPDTMPVLEQKASGAAHVALYGFLFGLPISGWALVSASVFNIPTVLFGMVPWPHLPVLSTLPDKAPVEAVLKSVHNYGAWTLLALITLHAAAAFRHHLILRDGVLLRMLPTRRRPQPESANAMEPRRS
ncbi:MAG TPA: cytochrome b [Caulobacteraceae bacterium]